MIIRNMMPLKSKYLHSTGYSPERQQAAIRFRNGLLRWYPIDVQTWQQLIAAKSAGRFFNERIKFTKEPGTKPLPSQRQRSRPFCSKSAADFSGVHPGQSANLKTGLTA